MNLDALTVTAIATAVLAAVGVVSIVANVYLARATSRAAAAAQVSNENQETELELLGRQLELSEKQFASAQEAARPKLRSDIFNMGAGMTAGAVKFIHGSEPAYDVEVWIWGRPVAGQPPDVRRVWAAGLLVPGQSATFSAYSADPDELDRIPFEGFLDRSAPDHGIAKVGLRWRRSNGTVDTLVQYRQVGVSDTDSFKG